MGKGKFTSRREEIKVGFLPAGGKKYMREINKSPFLREMFDFLSTFKHSRLQEEDFEEFRKIYRRRKVEEIISSGYFLACYEPALILYEKAKERGIPVRFIEMISKKSQPDDILSHCYVELRINGQWKIIDPMRQKICRRYPRDMTLFSDEGPYKWNSFDEFHEAQQKFVTTLREGRKI